MMSSDCSVSTLLALLVLAGVGLCGLPDNATVPCGLLGSTSSCCAISDVLYACSTETPDNTPPPSNDAEYEAMLSRAMAAAAAGDIFAVRALKAREIAIKMNSGTARPDDSSCWIDTQGLTRFGTLTKIAAFDGSKTVSLQNYHSSDIPEFKNFTVMSPTTTVQLGWVLRHDWWLEKSPACLAIVSFGGNVSVQTAPHIDASFTSPSSPRFGARSLRIERIFRIIAVQGNGPAGTKSSALGLTNFRPDIDCTAAPGVPSASAPVKVCAKTGTSGKEVIFGMLAFDPNVKAYSMITVLVLRWPNPINYGEYPTSWTTGSSSANLKIWFAAVEFGLEIDPNNNQLIAVCKVLRYSNEADRYSNNFGNFVVSTLDR